MIGFRLAQVEDAQDIGTLIEQCFQDSSSANIRQIQESLAPAEGRAVSLAVNDAETVGFVAGFTTLSPEGVQRWEIDLGFSRLKQRPRRCRIKGQATR